MNLPNQNIYKLKVTNYRISLALKSPNIFDLEELVYPKNSVIHYCSFNPASYGPTNTEPFFKNITRKLPLINIKEYENAVGTIAYYPNKYNMLANEHRRVNKIFKFETLDNIKTIDPLNPVIVNYDMVDHLYKYRDRYDISYNTWKNKETTLWSNVLKIKRKFPDNNHFVTIDLDGELTSVGKIKVLSKLSGLAMLKHFKNREDYLAKELFIYLINNNLRLQGKDSKNLYKTIFDEYTLDDFKNLNIVLTKDGKYSVYPVSDLIEKFKDRVKLNKYMGYEFIRIMVLRFVQISENISVIESTNTDIKPDEDKTFKEDTDALPKESKDTVQEIENNKELETKDNENDAFSLDEIDEFKDIEFDLPKETDDIYLKDESITDDNISNIDDETITDINDETKSTLTSDEINKEVSLESYEEPEEDLGALNKLVNAYIVNNNLNKIEINKLLKEVEKSKEVDAPYLNKPLKEASIVTEKDIIIDSENSDIKLNAKIPDDSMKKSSLLNYDKQYIKHVLLKDMAGVISSVQRSGMIIKDIETKENINASTKSIDVSIKVKPIDGLDSTLKYSIPIINEDGTYMVGGVTYKLRKQRKDVPIRKTSNDEVALTSHYGKLFVNRASQKRFDESYYLYNTIIKLYSTPDSIVKSIVPTPAFNNNYHTPLMYSYLSRYFKEMTIDKYKLYLNYSDRESLIKDRFVLKELEKELEKDSYTLIGLDDRANPILVGNNGLFYIYENKEYNQIGTIYQMLDISNPKNKEFADIKVLGARIPLVFVFGYLTGIKALLKYIKANYELIGVNSKFKDDNSIIVTFANHKLIIKNPTKEQQLLFNGFQLLEKELKTFNFEIFDDKTVYLSLLKDKGVSARNLKELTLLDQMFVDHITKDILKMMKEPTSFKGLLFRSIELLLTDWYPDSQDTKYQLITGYDRINGVIYKNFVDTIRGYKLKNLYNKTKLDLNPLSVSMDISKDQVLLESINPINDIKQQEDVTYTGFGGRSKQSLNKKSRAFHKHDIGIMSEATKESSDVGISAYLSANPSITNLRGMVKPLTEKELETTSLFSTPALLAPGSEYDAAVRVNFVSVQQSHTISTEGYHQPYFRTGYEYMVAKRTTNNFAFRAEDDGEVLEVNDTAIVVKYKNGEQKAVKIGDTLGHSEGQYYLHPIKTSLTKGQKFTKDKVIAYNSYFFEPDLLYPGEVILKAYRLVKTAIVENGDVFEDSSSIRDTIAHDFRSTVVEQRKFIFDIDQNLILNVKIGDKLKVNDVLLFALENYENVPSNIDEKTLESLKRFANIAPKANIEGEVLKIKVFYNGNIEDASESVKKIIKQSDKRLAEENKFTDPLVTTGKVDISYRVDGKQLTPKKIAIIFYLKHVDPIGVGDKVVFSNQMKSVIGGVIDYPITTTEGEQIDAFFGYRSILARVVNSPLIIGTTNVLIDKITNRFIELYEEK